MNISAVGGEILAGSSEHANELAAVLQKTEAGLREARSFEDLDAVLKTLQSKLTDEIEALSQSERFQSSFEGNGAMSGAENLVLDHQNAFFPEKQQESDDPYEQHQYVDPWVRYVYAVSEYVNFLQKDIAPNLPKGKLQWIHRMTRPALGNPLSDQKYQVLLELLDQLQSGPEHMAEMGKRMEMQDIMDAKETDSSEFVIFNDYFKKYAVPLMKGADAVPVSEKEKHRG